MKGIDHRRRSLHAHDRRAFRSEKSARLLLVAVAAVFMAYFLKLKLPSDPTPPTIIPTPHCLHVIPSDTRNTTLTPENSHSYCLTSPICITPRKSIDDRPSLYLHPHLHSRVTSPTCTATGPSLDSPFNHALLNCSSLFDAVLCAQGHYDRSQETAHCPNLRSFSDAPTNAKKIRGIAIIVPPYTYQANIFHYSQAILPALHVTSALPKLFRSWAGTAPPAEITLLFRGDEPHTHGAWQRDLTKALVKERLTRHGVRVNVVTSHEDERHFFPGVQRTPEELQSICADHAILLGPRYKNNDWPFSSGDSQNIWPFSKLPGSTSVATNGTVPVEAVAFRSAVYSAMKLKTNIPKLVLDAGFAPPPKGFMVDLPPLVLAYSRRNTDPDPPPGGSMKPAASTRRFSDADDHWFVDMLKGMADKHGLSYKVVQPTGQTPFAEQVAMYKDAGVIVGIHGANLMNAIFAPPFASIIEVGNMPVQCYISGANSGLAFMMYQTLHEATAEESWCPKDGVEGENCKKYINWRRVMINTEHDRFELTKNVGVAIEYLMKLHREFKHLHGIPVGYDSLRHEYGIDWSQGKSSSSHI